LINDSSFSKLGIVGIGLIGGSIAKGVRHKLGDNIQIVGVDSDQEVVNSALNSNIFNHVSSDLRTLEICDFVVMCVPPKTGLQVLDSLSMVLGPGTSITDTSSTKRQICNMAWGKYAGKLDFVGSHPMAGKEASGYGHSDPQLFNGCNWFICYKEQDSAALRRLEELIFLLDAKPYYITPEDHDRIVAGSSHLAFVLSSAFISALHTSVYWEEIRQTAGTGFRDMTRLAAGNSRMYAEIVQTNSDEILAWLEVLKSQLNDFEKLILSGDGEALTNWFEQAYLSRHSWMNNKPW
jgi:prephenate dehydrogenase